MEKPTNVTVHIIEGRKITSPDELGASLGMMSVAMEAIDASMLEQMILETRKNPELVTLGLGLDPSGARDQRIARHSLERGEYLFRAIVGYQRLLNTQKGEGSTN